MTRCTLRRLAALTLALLATPAFAGTVTVVTSFPKELTQAYKTAFETANPDDQAGDPEQEHACRASPMCASCRPASGPTCSGPRRPTPSRCWPARSCCDNVADAGQQVAPAKVGSYPINDPEGLYLGQALAGYGLMWNTRYMAANKLPAPSAVGRPDQAGVLRPRGDERALALGHHPPDRRDDAAGRRLGQGLDPAAADRRQLAPRSPSAASACPTA